MEEWRTIIEFPTYEVSNHGRVRNMSTGRILSPYQHPRTGLWAVPLRKAVKQYNRNIHRLVAEAFIHPPYPEMVPVHLDGNRDNNHLDNLDWKTRSQAREITDTRVREEPRDYRPVEAIDLVMQFPNSLDAARYLGGLERKVILAAQSMGSLYYMRTRWKFIG